MHKTANVLNKLPKSCMAKAKRVLQDIWMAETKNEAVAAFEAFAQSYAPKYDKAVQWLSKDRDALLAFTTSPPNTGSTCAARIRLKARSAQCDTARSDRKAASPTRPVFKFIEAAQKSWRCLDGHNQLPKLITGVKFADGIEVLARSAAPQAKAA